MIFSIIDSHIHKNTKAHEYREISIQFIEETNKVGELLVENALIINCLYGNSQELS
jgi:hypothetical protein